MVGCRGREDDEIGYQSTRMQSAPASSVFNTPAPTKSTTPPPPAPASDVNNKLRVAIVGSGISGLAAAGALTEAGHSVVVYEANSHVGGHAWTYRIDDCDGKGTPCDVDLGFQVFNQVSRCCQSMLSVDAVSRCCQSMLAGDAVPYRWPSSIALGLFCLLTPLHSTLLCICRLLIRI